MPNSLAVRLADEAIEIGPPQAAKSYLNIAAVVAAARTAGVDAVHPGYGFLAESPAFADAVDKAGLTFVGPRGETIRLMGDKVAGRAAAIRAGVPTIPGSEGRIDDFEAARAIVDQIGFPVMIKAAAGGGGRGIRVARDAAEFAQMLPLASAEAQAAFGDGGVYVEKLIERARHIEVQVLGDGRDVIHLFERECSLQRRRQKVWEEAPSPVLSAASRERLCAAAVALAKSVDYRGAGTLEFLYDDVSDDFYFIEMNTRIQVEHPVTEWSPASISSARCCGSPAASRSASARRTSPTAAMPSRSASTPRTRPTTSCLSPARSAISTFPAAPACASTPCSSPATRSRPSTTRCSAS